ncbi:MAG TPA: hypothetical protein PLF78_00440 [Caulobacter sp.]|nr:hypothetical protein [Caulobacter sp.]
MPSRGILGAALALVLVQPARAQTVSPAPDAVSITVYRDGRVDTADLYDPDSAPEGLVLVTETRTIDLPAGRARISFRGVAEGIVPQTAAIEGLPGEMVERNQDYDLLSPGALIAKSIGKTVRLVRTDRATGETVEQRAIVRSGPDGVMLEIDGELEALRCSGLPERLVFDEAPEGLTDKPTLSLVTRSPEAGRYKVRLTYLAVGVNWSADYVARIRPDGRTLDLTGWITLANRGNTTFTNAPTQVLAGRVQRDDDTRPTEVEAIALAARCWPLPGNGFARLPLLMDAPPPPPPPPRMATPVAEARVEDIVVTGSRIARQEELGDYKLYVLPDPTPVAANQTKQVLMLHEAAVPFERVYGFRVQQDELDDGAAGDDHPASVLLRLQNRKERGLGKPLPAGAVSVMEPDGGRLVLAGEDTIEDAPVGLPVEIEMGEAMDVAVRPTVVRAWTVRKKQRGAIEVAIANDKTVPIRFELAHDSGGWRRGFRIVSSSDRYAEVKGRPTWSLTLAPGERRLVRYTIEAEDE